MKKEPAIVRHGFAYLVLAVALSASVSLHFTQAQRLEEATRLLKSARPAACKPQRSASFDPKDVRLAAYLPKLPVKALSLSQQNHGTQQQARRPR